jgi:hypothetical protein
LIIVFLQPVKPSAIVFTLPVAAALAVNCRARTSTNLASAVPASNDSGAHRASLTQIHVRRRRRRGHHTRFLRGSKRHHPARVSRRSAGSGITTAGTKTTTTTSCSTSAMALVGVDRPRRRSSALTAGTMACHLWRCTRRRHHFNDGAWGAPDSHCLSAAL